jgi:mRNA deadenylase 3'-5' endonuclease subunit Ccr4
MAFRSIVETTRENQASDMAWPCKESDKNLEAEPKPLQELPDTVQHQHSFKFYSAYTYDEKRHTVYHSEFEGTVDYIFYTNDSIHLKGRLELYSVDYKKAIGFLPNALIPSDHLPLISCFEFK